MTAIQFSFYELSLLAFLSESHPDLSLNKAFIKARADIAATAYSEAFMNGFSVTESAAIATKALYRGLHFSRHDTLVSILWNEFSAAVPAEETTATALRLLPELESIFAKYPLDDDFGYSPEYNALYTELTGTIQLKLEEDGSL